MIVLIHDNGDSRGSSVKSIWIERSGKASFYLVIYAIRKRD